MPIIKRTRSVKRVTVSPSPKKETTPLLDTQRDIDFGHEAANRLTSQTRGACASPTAFIKRNLFDEAAPGSSVEKTDKNENPVDFEGPADFADFNSPVAFCTRAGRHRRSLSISTPIRLEENQIETAIPEQPLSPRKKKRDDIRKIEHTLKYVRFLFDGNAPETPARTKKDRNVFNLRAKSVSAELRKPFISRGYREDLSIKDCLRSAFHLRCNSTLNVWISMILLLCFTYKFYNFFTFPSSPTYERPSISDPLMWPLVCQAFTILLCCFVNACAHALRGASVRASRACFFVDYAVMSTFMLANAQAFYWYTRPINEELIIYKYPLELSIACGVTLSVCMISTFILHACQPSKTKTVFSTFFQLTPIVCTTIPLIAQYSPRITQSTPWIIQVFSEPSAINVDYLYSLENIQPSVDAYLIITAAILYIGKLPERLLPGRFDYIGNSSQLVQVLVAIATWLQFDKLYHSLKERVEEDMEDSMTVGQEGRYAFLASTGMFLLIATLFSARALKQKVV